MSDLAKAVAVTAELCGTSLSEAAGEILVDELARYDRGQVLQALTLCRQQLKGRLTMAAILERMDDGRPGADEAWATAILAHDEANSVVWTAETAAAYWAARNLLDEGDKVGARMAFKQAYEPAVARARVNGVPVKWEVTMGHSAAGREPVLLRAAELSRISQAYAASLLPPPAGGNTLHLPDKRAPQ
jgi:hypothetical protein